MNNILISNEIDKNVIVNSIKGYWKCDFCKKWFLCLNNNTDICYYCNNIYNYYIKKLPKYGYTIEELNNLYDYYNNYYLLIVNNINFLNYLKKYKIKLLSLVNINYSNLKLFVKFKIFFKILELKLICFEDINLYNYHLLFEDNIKQLFLYSFNYHCKFIKVMDLYKKYKYKNEFFYFIYLRNYNKNKYIKHKDICNIS